MTTLQTPTGLAVRNILYLTDFSEASKRAAPLVTGIAKCYGATVHALNVLLPRPYVFMTPDVIVALNEAEEQTAHVRMQQIESSFRDCSLKTCVIESSAIRPVLEDMVENRKIDLIILGTHGRTGLSKFVMGSAAEEIIRHIGVPVLTIGPMASVNNSSELLFNCILFATDFKIPGSVAATCATSLAQDNDAQLLLLHVIRQANGHKGAHAEEMAEDVSVANAMHKLHELLPREVELFARPKILVEHGDAAKKILEVAEKWAADLIVMGAHPPSGIMQSATHVETSTVHKVIATATCPLMTVCG